MSKSSVLVRIAMLLSAAESQGPRIAHEHFSRMLVIEQEAQAGTGQGRAENGKMRIAQGNGDDDVATAVIEHEPAAKPSSPSVRLTALLAPTIMTKTKR